MCHGSFAEVLPLSFLRREISFVETIRLVTILELAVKESVGLWN